MTFDYNSTTDYITKPWIDIFFNSMTNIIMKTLV